MKKKSIKMKAIILSSIIKKGMYLKLNQYEKYTHTQKAMHTGTHTRTLALLLTGAVQESSGHQGWSRKLNLRLTIVFKVSTLWNGLFADKSTCVCVCVCLCIFGSKVTLATPKRKRHDYSVFSSSYPLTFNKILARRALRDVLKM